MQSQNIFQSNYCQTKNDKYNLNETINGNKSLYDNESSDKTNMDKDKTIWIKIEQKKGGYYRRFYAEWNTRERFVQELQSKGKQFHQEVPVQRFQRTQTNQQTVNQTV